MLRQAIKWVVFIMISCSITAYAQQTDKTQKRIEFIGSINESGVHREYALSGMTLRPQNQDFFLTLVEYPDKEFRLNITDAYNWGLIKDIPSLKEEAKEIFKSLGMFEKVVEKGWNVKITTSESSFVEDSSKGKKSVYKVISFEKLNTESEQAAAAKIKLEEEAAAAKIKLEEATCKTNLQQLDEAKKRWASDTKKVLVSCL